MKNNILYTIVIVIMFTFYACVTEEYKNTQSHEYELNIIVLNQINSSSAKKPPDDLKRLLLPIDACETFYYDPSVNFHRLDIKDTYIIRMKLIKEYWFTPIEATLRQFAGNSDSPAIIEGEINSTLNESMPDSLIMIGMHDEKSTEENLKKYLSDNITMGGSKEILFYNPNYMGNYDTTSCYGKPYPLFSHIDSLADNIKALLCQNPDLKITVIYHYSCGDSEVQPSADDTTKTKETTKGGIIMKDDCPQQIELHFNPNTEKLYCEYNPSLKYTVQIAEDNTFNKIVRKKPLSRSKEKGQLVFPSNDEENDFLNEFKKNKKQSLNYYRFIASCKGTTLNSNPLKLSEVCKSDGSCGLKSNK